MGRLREEVAEQAATAAMLHKFNSGAREPTGEVTRSHMVQGLQATKEVGNLFSCCVARPCGRLHPTT